MTRDASQPRDVEAYRLGPLPLWATPLAGLCVGLTLALALSRGGLPLAVGVVIGILVLSTKPWTLWDSGLDRRHEILAASSPLRSSTESRPFASSPR